jgi:hypothetical protein
MWVIETKRDAHIVINEGRFSGFHQGEERCLIDIIEEVGGDFHMWLHFSF